MKLHELKPASGSVKTRKRIGRGVGSGWGKSAGRGNKGHNARSGGGVRPGFEGGQMPLHRRLPKRGFQNFAKKDIAVINIRDLGCFESGTVIDLPALTKAGLVKGRNDGIKLLGQGEITAALTVKLNAVSRSAQEKIVAAGGTVEVV
jgi:large subunit ribosomal protein L15